MPRAAERLGPAQQRVEHMSFGIPFKRDMYYTLARMKVPLLAAIIHVDRARRVDDQASLYI